MRKGWSLEVSRQAVTVWARELPLPTALGGGVTPPSQNDPSEGFYTRAPEGCSGALFFLSAFGVLTIRQVQPL